MTTAPEIRFEGYAGPWEQRKLVDEVEFFSGLTYAPGNVVGKPGTLVLRSSNVSDGVIVLNDNVYVDSTIALSENVRPGDIVVVVRNGSRALIGKHAQVKRCMPDTVIGAFMTGIRSDNPEFMNALLSTPAFDAEVAANMGATINQITLGMFGAMSFRFPNADEQKTIGGYFNNLDNLITLHQRKHEKLLIFKKSMLEKMFPKNGALEPEIRFKGFTGPWEQRKWSETVSISTEMVDPKSGKYDDLLHVGPGNIESFTGRLYDNVHTVKEDALISGKFHFQPGDVIYGKINPQLGKYTYAQFEGLASADAYVLNSKDELCQEFLFALLQSEAFFKYSVSVSMRSGMPKINRDELNAFEYLAPGIEEQKTIGSFLLSIDNLITLHQRKLEKLKTMKQSLLQKMFV